MTVTTFSYWFALFLSLGSLLFYLSTAFWNRIISKEADSSTMDFNLGVPEGGSRENLFSVALVAAGTSLSTVFVFFLTAGSTFGGWMILCPVMFGVGNYLMFKVYSRIRENGYFSEESQQVHGLTGLLPYIGKAVTGCNAVGWMLVLLSLLNLLAVLTLELIVGVEVLGYLASKTLQVEPSSAGEFCFFAISVLLLLGYVFVGGFRAVVTSDLWQMKIMKWAIVLTIISLIVLASSGATSSSLSSLAKMPPTVVLFGFILNVVLANLFAPMSQESSWQRFRAFAQGGSMSLKTAMTLSISKSVCLWTGLIVLAFGTMLLIPPTSNIQLSSMSNVLEALRSMNDWWFPLFVFPVMSVAALSAMYSTADTCVSSILYLIEFSNLQRSNFVNVSRKNLPITYYVSMGLIFFISLGVYLFVRVYFNPTILQLVFSVFSNLIVIAPTVITAAIVPPQELAKLSGNRTPYIMSSLILGFIAYWGSSITAIIMGETFLWLSQLSIAFGLLGALIPVLPLWISKKSDVKVEGSMA